MQFLPTVPRYQIDVNMRRSLVGKVKTSNIDQYMIKHAYVYVVY